MKIDMHEYMDNYLKEIEMCITDKKDEIPHFNPKYLRQAVMNEMNLADEETGTIEIPDDREEALKQAEERILEFIKSSFDDEAKREKPGPPKSAPHTIIKSHTIPQNISWGDAPIKENNVSFQCVGCGKEHELQKSVFTESQARSEEGLIQTDQVITYGRTAMGNVVAFIVAVVIGVIISLVMGKTSTTTPIISAVIFLILRKIFVPAFMDKLPIWIYECGQCRNKSFIASNGNSVAIGKV